MKLALLHKYKISKNFFFGTFFFFTLELDCHNHTESIPLDSAVMPIEGA